MDGKFWIELTIEWDKNMKKQFLNLFKRGNFFNKCNKDKIFQKSVFLISLIFLNPPNLTTWKTTRISVCAAILTSESRPLEL